jgi:hypothetical protein
MGIDTLRVERLLEAVFSGEPYLRDSVRGLAFSTSFEAPGVCFSAPMNWRMQPVESPGPELQSL